MNLKTSNMNDKIIQSKTIVFSPDNDRHILIMKEENKVVGLNYCQGDDLEYFIDHFDEIDHDLTDFFNAIEPYLTDGDQIDRINQAIWAHFDYRNRIDGRENS